MSSLQSKITKHTKKQENINHNWSTETDREMTEIIKLAHNDVKTEATNILHMLKDTKENMNIMRREMKNINKN